MTPIPSACPLPGGNLAGGGEPVASILSELARAKATFQLRTIAAVLAGPMGLHPHHFTSEQEI